VKTWLALLCTCLALGLVATGCGGDDNDDSSSADSGATTSEKQPPADTGGGSGSGGATSGAKGKTVVMKDISFKPETVTVPKGGTVTWTNDDSVGHDVTKAGGPGPSWKSGDPGGLNGGDTYKQKFTAPGTVKYVCSVHPGMEGTVVVK
jgi:plastocyanin